ncbi:Transmembrane protein TauE like [Ostreococcus tauri]|uniref:Transmembrane protein TauE like n=1 Tax=Ostreococcus tauri TaxID=70448 RepID=Q019P4_OSTTA|nr:Transmembrane protein TauE like [Ostreococcus tauri]CAL53881.1 Transmembrane protein TauE like [Ostreococcus tauri]|eukprot:XP_003079223.1 Transmembrane protein TauE like [Ostreococcus tauri]
MAFDTVVTALTAGEVTLVVVACCVGAFLIGAVGIGGVVVLPALLVAGVALGPAIASVYVAFLPAGVLKLCVLGRVRGLIPWRAALACGAPAAVGAAAGGVLVESSPRRVMTFLVGGVAALAGLRDAMEIVDRKLKARAASRVTGGANGETRAGGTANVETANENGKRTHDSGDTVNSTHTHESIVEVEVVSPAEAPEEQTTTLGRTPSSSTTSFVDRFRKWYFVAQVIPSHERWEPTNNELGVLAVTGLLVGLSSVLTGTGGPLIFIPFVLTWKRSSSINRKTIIGCSAVLAAFLSSAAVVSLLSAGLRPDPGLTILMAFCAAGGIGAGARILQIASREFLQSAMTVLLLAVAGATIAKAATE